MGTIYDFVPVKFYLSGWPTDIIGYPNQLDAVGVSEITFEAFTSSQLVTDGTIQILTEISFDLPIIPGLSVVLLSNNGLTEIGFHCDLSYGSFELALYNLSVSIRVQTELLKRMESSANGFVEAPPDPTTGETQPIEIGIESAELNYNSKGEIAFTFADGAPAMTVQPFMIGNSGVIIDVAILKIILSAEAAEALPSSIPNDWRGIFLQDASIHLPEGLNDILPDDVTLEDFFIGSGGFCGKVTGNWEVEPENPIDAESGDVFGFRFRLTSIGIEFKQNTLVSGSLTGYLQLPFFDEPIEVEIGLTNDGDFTIAVGDSDGLLILEKENIITIEVSSLEFIKEENTYAIKLSGKITPLLADLEWPSFELKGLTIHSDGTVSVEGGWIELPDQKALDFHVFQIEIAQLGFGSDEMDGDLYKWVGFSGGIQIIQALPLRGGVEGLKVMWTEGDKYKLKMGGVYLSFEIKDVLTFDGSVYFIDEDNPEIKEFRGGVDLNLIPLNLGIDAQFITGKTSDYNYFYIAVGLDLPIGIPLGPPVLGLYGLAGLYGHNMTLDYQNLIDYDDVVHRPDLTDVDNWFNQKDAMAFGAGLTVGTLPDAKFIVKAKALFVILIPGPVLLIEGHAGMLSVSENFPLRVMAVLDPAAGTFLMNISATYQYSKEEGNLLNIAGSAEAYFSAADPGSWHLYLGEDKPEAKRIRADILSLFKAETYLMVDHDGLLMGAWIGYSLDKKYGILRVILEAWMGGELGISTMPFQAKGFVTLYGNAELSAGIVSLGISVEANVAAEAPKPLYMSASLEVQLKTPLGKPNAKIKLKWEKQGVPSYPVPLSATLGVEHCKVSKNWEIPKYSPYAVDADGLYPGEDILHDILKVPVVPPDVYMVLNFDKPVIDLNKVGANPNPITPHETVGDYQFKYELRNVTLEYRDEWDENIDDNDTEWENYVTQNDDYTLTGSWQFIPDTNDIVNTKLVLNASTPFEISRLLNEDDLWYTLLNVYNPNYPCYGEDVLEKICADFENRDTGYYYGTIVQDNFVFTSPFPMVVHGYPAPWLDTEKALNNTDGYQTIECLNIKAQEPTEAINLKVIKEVIITAGIGYDSYLKFTDEYSEADIELYINQSSLDLANGIIPAFIHFPKAFFGETPYKVWITCIVVDPSDFLFNAFDDEGDIVESVNINEGRNLNGALVYTLEADVPIRKIGLLGYDFRILEICYEVHHQVENSNILVTLPDSVVQAEVHLSKNSQGTIYLYDKENTEIQQLAFDIPEDVPDDEVQPVTLSTGTQPFQSFLILGQFDIIRVCGITQEALETYDYNAGLSTHLQTTLEENWGKHTAQILHPNKYYRLQIETASMRKNGGAWEEQVFTENMYFKTGNPPGPPTSTQTEVGDNVADRYDLEGPLTDLSAYIDYTIPAGAAADEAQPYIYRSYDIGVVYNESYIEQMYLMAELSLKIRLLDNNNLPVLNAAGEEFEFVNMWGDNPEPSLTREETHYEDILNESGCVVMTGVSAETNNEAVASSRELLLKPQIQYRARVIAGNTSVYEFAFLTSRFSNFLHHIHSYQDVIWNHYHLLQNADYEINSAVLEQILNSAEEEFVKFEQLMSLFDLNPRPLPERIEVALINDKHLSYGLLLESPEPLDWDRTELGVFFTSGDDTIEEFDSSVKIINGSIKSNVIPLGISIDYNYQWVDILVMESTDLLGFTIEYLPATADEEETYREYFSFAESNLYLAGTLIRIYNGSQPDASDETELINLYAGHQSSTFDSAGTYIRIKDSTNEIIHTRPIISDSRVNELDTNVIKNLDRTRAFIFVKRGSDEFSELDNGIYRLDFKYKREIGSDAPILKRFGFTGVEETFIEMLLKE